MGEYRHFCLLIHGLESHAHAASSLQHFKTRHCIGSVIRVRIEALAITLISDRLTSWNTVTVVIVDYFSQVIGLRFHSRSIQHLVLLLAPCQWSTCRRDLGIFLRRVHNVFDFVNGMCAGRVEALLESIGSL